MTRTRMTTAHQATKMRVVPQSNLAGWADTDVLGNVWVSPWTVDGEDDIAPTISRVL
jgi:hypothetical protein